MSANAGFSFTPFFAYPLVVPLQFAGFFTYYIPASTWCTSGFRVHTALMHAADLCTSSYTHFMSLIALLDRCLPLKLQWIRQNSNLFAVHATWNIYLNDNECALRSPRAILRLTLLALKITVVTSPKPPPQRQDHSALCDFLAQKLNLHRYLHNDMELAQHSISNTNEKHNTISTVTNILYSTPLTNAQQPQNLNLVHGLEPSQPLAKIAQSHVILASLQGGSDHGA